MKKKLTLTFIAIAITGILLGIYLNRSNLEFSLTLAVFAIWGLVVAVKAYRGTLVKGNSPETRVGDRK